MEKLNKIKSAGCIFLFICTFLAVSCEEGRVLVTEVNHCSRLDFSNIEWPDDLSSLAIDTYSLALNITGSYEGNRGWSTISNNFDGQGISLGIFQQNLGQGSLQRLLVKADRLHPRMFSEYFSQQQRASLSFMLNAWRDGRRFNLSGDGLRVPASIDEELASNSLAQFPNPTDMDYESEFLNDGFIFTKASSSVNQFSVDWAVKNLYYSNGRTFKPEWKRAFQRLAGDPRYISLQLELGNWIHKKAMSFMELYEVRELRSYLFFYDIIVQNGGINEETRQDYLADIAGKELTENQKMKILLVHRVKRSKERWRADVMARKFTILDGFGLVHKKNRNFSEEFCLPIYDQMLIR